MQCKAQSGGIQGGFASICNAALRPDSYGQRHLISVIQWTRLANAALRKRFKDGTFTSSRSSIVVKLGISKKVEIMAPKCINFASRMLVTAGFAFCSAMALAASGFWINQTQEVLVTPGMSMPQVRQALGHPTQFIKYRNQPGPTFTYRVIGTLDTLFDIDFDANGQVVSTNERIVPIDGGSDRDR